MRSIKRLLFVVGAAIPLVLLSCDSEEEQPGDSLPSPQGTGTGCDDFLISSASAGRVHEVPMGERDRGRTRRRDLGEQKNCCA
jgi:hypothetical protein